MMLNKRLQKPIHLRQLPAPEHLLLRLLLMLSVDRTHRHHTVDIRHTDRIRPIRHKQSSLTHPISTPYLPVKISMVCHHIRGKKPQPLRKHPAVLPKSRHPIRRQMKQNRPHIPRQKTGRINILRNLLLHSNLHTGLDPLHPPLSRRHIPQRQIRIPIQNTRRKLQLNNPAGQILLRDLTTLLSPPRKIKKLSPRNIPQIHIHKPLNNLPSPPRLKRRIQKRQNHIITHTTHSPPKPRQPPKRPPSKPNQQTSEALTQATSTHIRSPSHTPHQHTSEAHLSTHISTHPKLFSQPSSTHIRSPSLKPHQHTSEALLSSHISIHPKLFSQATSAYIRSSSQPSSTHIRSSSLKPHQHTSEALSLKSHKTVTKTPDINQPVNQSISQPIRPTIFFHNYNPKYSKNKFKYYTKTPHPIQNSLYPPIPSRHPAKKLTPPTSSAAPMPLPSPNTPQENSAPAAAPLRRLSVRPSPHSSHPHKKRAPSAQTPRNSSQNQTTSSPTPQLPQLPLQPIRTRLLPQRIRPLFTPPLFNPLSDSLADSLGDSLTDSLFNPLINPHLLNLKTLHIRHHNLSASNISSTSPQLPQFPLQPIRTRLLPQRIRPLFTLDPCSIP